MPVDPKWVKALRDKTNAGIMDCRQALEKCNGDMAKAEEFLKAKGLASAAKQADRATKQGKVGSYIHGGGKGGAMVELCSETDFVARAPEFEELLKDVCLQVYAMEPQYVSRADVPAAVIDELKAGWAEELKGKPAEVAEKIVQGKLEKNLYTKKCLLDQVFVKDPDGKLTVGDLIKGKIGTFKENIVVRRFARFAIGE